MASFSSSLEQALRRALQYANERSHEYATLEHLLLSLLDDRDAAAVMRACDWLDSPPGWSADCGGPPREPVDGGAAIVPPAPVPRALSFEGGALCIAL